MQGQMRSPESKSCNGMSQLSEWGAEVRSELGGSVCLISCCLLILKWKTSPEGGKYYKGGGVNWSLKHNELWGRGGVEDEEKASEKRNLCESRIAQEITQSNKQSGRLFELSLMKSDLHSKTWRGWGASACFVKCQLPGRVASSAWLSELECNLRVN